MVASIQRHHRSDECDLIFVFSLKGYALKGRAPESLFGVLARHRQWLVSTDRHAHRVAPLFFTESGIDAHHHAPELIWGLVDEADVRTIDELGAVGRRDEEIVLSESQRAFVLELLDFLRGEILLPAAHALDIQ